MDQNVKVAVRCRPLSSKEIRENHSEIITMQGSSVTIRRPEGQRGHGEDKEKTFNFDFCYFTDSVQEQVYKDLGIPLVKQALEGFNGTIFAYGQTGSGKTFSMMGSADMPGIIPQLNNGLFDHIDEKADQLISEHEAAGEKSETRFMVTVSFLEIYNEIIKDLLNPSSKQLNIRENPKDGIYVEDLCNLIVRSPEDIMSLIEQGNTVRKVAATKMNEQSSRSHSCFTIKVEQMTTTVLDGGKERKKMVNAKLNLVDLAGSERAAKTGASGSTLKEGANINKSLMALGTVINALAEAKKGKQHIPYRDSKLTRLLQESLGGNSATVMLAALSPASYNYDETLGTLRYANRAKNIENSAVRNEDVHEKEIRNLKAEIEKLRAALESGGGVVGTGAANPELAKKLAEMEAERAGAWEEREKLSRQLEAERQSNMHTAIADMMGSVKEQKVEQMKKIKRLQNEKQSLNKKQATIKKDSEDLKLSLDANIVSYQKLQTEYESLVSTGEEDLGDLPDRMAIELSAIEDKRERWKSNKDQYKATKKRLEKVEEEIQDERAELVTTTGLLEANDAIRQKIIAEEREKAKAIIDGELHKARAKLAAEKEGLRSDLEKEMNGELSRLTEENATLSNSLQEKNNEMHALQAQLNESKHYGERMEEKVASLEVDEERASNDAEARARLEVQVEELKANRARLLEDQSQLRSNGQMLGKEEKYALFKTMMDAFETERQAMAKKCSELQRLLRGATRDLAFIADENQRLQRDLRLALTYEP